MKARDAVYEATPCQRLAGACVADEILGTVALEVAELTRAGRRPRLVSLIFGDPSAAEVYVRNQRRIAERVGIHFEEVTFPASTTESVALAAIAQLDADPDVTGIILQRPVPPGLSVKRLQGTIQPSKDVEGMHPSSIGQIVYGISDFGPCTALAAVEMLRRTGLKIEGLEVVVIGHSEIVGKPIAFLLMAAGATVTVCHHMTRSVVMHARRADAVFVAVGKPKLIGPEMIKPGAAVIDIGINRVSGADGKSRLVGDVDYNGVEKVAGWLTPVPGGVGPVTLAMLMRNTLLAARRQRDEAAASPGLRRQPALADQLDHVIIRDLDLPALIGVNSGEHLQQQPVRVNIELEAERGGEGLGVVCYDSVASQVKSLVADGHVRLVEELADRIASVCLADHRVHSAKVRLEKLQAIEGAGGAGVEIQRTRSTLDPYRSSC